MFLVVVCCSQADESEWRQRDESASKQGGVESFMCDVDTLDWLYQSLCQRLAGARCTLSQSDWLHARRSLSTAGYVLALLHIYTCTSTSLFL